MLMLANKRSRLSHVSCRRSSNARTLAGFLPPQLQAGWHLVAVRIRQKLPRWIAVLRMDTENAELPSVELTIAQPYLWTPFGFKIGVYYLPHPKSELKLDIYSNQAPPDAADVTFIPILRILASLLVCLQNPPGFVAALRSTSGNLPKRLRRAISATALNGQYMPKSYSNWLSWFDGWPTERIAALEASPHRIHRPLISALVFRADPANQSGLALTLASLLEQIYPACETVIREPGETTGLAENVLGEYVAVVQAGEVLPRHALLLLSEELVRLNFPDIVFADEDLIDEQGVRSLPLFKPQPNLTLMCSALLSRGVWLIRREWLETMPRSDYAECVRLESWFAVYEAGRAAATHRIPYLLTHRTDHTESAPPETLAGVVESFLGRAGFEATVTSSFPLRIQWQPGALLRTRITLIVPSCLRGETQLSCLRQIFAKTTYPNYEMLVVVTQDEEFDTEQRRAIAELSVNERFRVHRIAEKNFNYSAANNIGASLATGEFLCLLNDDVSPIDGDWLDRMVGFFADPNCAIVGAKLFYPNLTTQHGGVIMGLAGLVEHANRFLPRGNPGYAWRAELDQELSAVTGACLLVRRKVFEAVGGLDEDFPTAFNDVDFCLRVREQGYGIVFAASVELIHHETLTFGRHYNAEATDQEHADIVRLRARWSKICKTDPFHNPNLSLIGRSEWNLAYPPRKQDEPAA